MSSFATPNPTGLIPIPVETFVLIDPLTGLPFGAAGANPFPVAASQVTSITATILSGASVSNDLDLGNARLGRIAMPAAWTAADITLQTSHNNLNWNNLFDKDGSEYRIIAASGRSMLIPLVDMLSVRYLRIRSGTSSAAVNQAADRTLILALVP